MTITPKISIDNNNLMVHGKTILKGVPENIVLTPGAGSGGLVTGAFIGASSSYSKSLHVFPVGVLEDLRFMCCFRFKLWWMTQRMGTCGKDIPLETQFMLVESKDNNEGDNDNIPTIYTVFLPLLEGQFRAVLQGNDKNELEICLESGDHAVETNQGLSLVYMHAGTNPFEVITQAVKAVENHMQTFHHREKKKSHLHNNPSSRLFDQAFIFDLAMAPSTETTPKQTNLHPVYTVTNIQNKVRILDGTKVTYSSWVKLFKLHARGYKVLHHIDGTRPPAATDEKYETWAEIDAIVLQWIYGTLSNDLLVRVLDAEATAHDAWIKIRDIFLNNKGSRAAALEHEFTNLTLAACSSMDEYCQKLKDLAEQLTDVDNPVNETRMVLQLVRGLPSEFDTVASFINQSSPKWDVACSMLQLEQHRQTELYFRVYFRVILLRHVLSSILS